MYALLKQTIVFREYWTESAKKSKSNEFRVNTSEHLYAMAWDLHRYKISM